MGDFSDDSSSELVLPVSELHSTASSLSVKIRKLEKKVSDEEFLEVETVCEDVKNKILYHEDEAYLSEAQNNLRRLHIGSELFVDICWLHHKYADFEFTKTINDFLGVKKFRNISKKIISKQLLESKRKKYFLKLAENCILKEDTREVARSPVEECQRPGEVTGTRDEEAAPENQETDASLELPLDASVPNEWSQIPENFTIIRGENETMELEMLHSETSVIPEEVSIQNPEAQTEILVQQPDVAEQVEEDIEEILKILDDQPAMEPVIESIRPESILEPEAEPVEEPQSEDLSPADGQKSDTSKVSDDLNLSSFHSEEKIRKKRRLQPMTDKYTFILDYAARAMARNREIVVERVQVYEGPPSLLRSLSVKHLMKAAGFTTSGFLGSRSDRLNALHTRNLTLEKRPAETPTPPKRRTFAEQQRVAETLAAQGQTAVVEDVGIGIGMRPIPERRQALSEIIPDPVVSVPRALDRPPPDQRSLRDVEIAERMIAAAIEPPDVRHSSVFAGSPPPRIQQMQGKKPEPKKSLPWFFSVKKTPPSPKWSEFKFVKGKLQEYWALAELEGNGKAVTVGEILKLEEEYTTANYLTLLRVVDKLSIRREVYLESADGDMLVMPFEIPYVSAGQYAVRGKPVKF